MAQPGLLSKLALDPKKASVMSALCEAYVFKVPESKLKHVPASQRTPAMVMHCLDKAQVPTLVQNMLTADLIADPRVSKRVQELVETMPACAALLPLEMHNEEQYWNALRHQDLGVVYEFLRYLSDTATRQSHLQSLGGDALAVPLTPAMIIHLLGLPFRTRGERLACVSKALRIMQLCGTVVPEVYEALATADPFYIHVVPEEYQTLTMVLRAFEKEPSIVSYVGKPIIAQLLQHALNTLPMSETPANSGTSPDQNVSSKK